MQLQVQYPNLQSMFGENSLYNTLYGKDQYDAAQANQQQNLSAAQQEQSIQAQKAPYEMGLLGAQAANENALAQGNQAKVPGIQAESGQRQLDYQAQLAVDPQLRAQKAKMDIAKSMSDDEWATLQNHVKSGIAQGDPHAIAVYQNFPEMMQDRQKLLMEGQNAARVAGINVGGELAREKMGIEAGKYANHSLDYLMYKSMTGNFQQQAGAYTAKAQQEAQFAQQATDPEERAFHQKRADKLAELADSARNADKDARSAAAYTALAKSPELAALGITPVVPQSGIGTDSAKPVADIIRDQPGGGTPSPSPTQGDKVTLYDRSGTPHLVPKANAQKAIQMGWTQAPQQAVPSIPTQ